MTRNLRTVLVLFLFLLFLPMSTDSSSSSPLPPLPTAAPPILSPSPPITLCPRLSNGRQEAKSGSNYRGSAHHGGSAQQRGSAHGVSFLLQIGLSREAVTLEPGEQSLAVVRELVCSVVHHKVGPPSFQGSAPPPKHSTLIVVSQMFGPVGVVADVNSGRKTSEHVKKGRNFGPGYLVHDGSGPQVKVMNRTTAAH